MGCAMECDRGITNAKPTQKMRALAVNQPCIRLTTILTPQFIASINAYPNHACWSGRKRKRNGRCDRGDQAHDTECDRENLHR